MGDHEVGGKARIAVPESTNRSFVVGDVCSASAAVASVSGFSDRPPVLVVVNRLGFGWSFGADQHSEGLDNTVEARIHKYRTDIPILD